MIQIIHNKIDDSYKGNYLKFEENKEGNFMIINNSEELLGYLEKMRVGAWMSYCLLLEDGCYLSAGCLDEAREMMKRLNAKLTQKTEGDSK